VIAVPGTFAISSPRARLSRQTDAMTRTARRPRRKAELRSLLAGGDRRSIARSGRAWALIEAEPSAVAALAALADDPDWLVSLRALDLLEKLAHDHPDWMAPHKSLFIGPLADRAQWEFHLQVVRALPLFPWNARQRRRVLQILERDAEHPQKFVRAWAVDSLATLSVTDPRLGPLVTRHLGELESSGSKACGPARVPSAGVWPGPGRDLSLMFP
jgi:hypothetical protein